MQNQSETSVGVGQIHNVPARDDKPDPKAAAGDVAVLSPDVALALVETERDFLPGKVRDAAAVVQDMKETLAAVERRMEQFDGQARKELTALIERAQRVETNTAELMQELRDLNTHLDFVQRTARESLLRFADLTRGRKRINVRSLLKVLKRVPLRRFWRVAREYNLVASSPLFDQVYYLERYPDVLQSGFDPVLHYVLFGGAEARVPGPNFDAPQYLEANPDVRESGANPLVHFLRYGVSEGRRLGSSAGRGSVLATAPGEAGIQRARPSRPPLKRPLKAEPRLWYFVGDSIEWLNSHPRLTGVGRVSTELLMTSLDSPGQRVQPCVLGKDHLKLVATSEQKQYETFLQKIGATPKYGEIRPSVWASGVSARSPEPGDHVFFTGHVWTPIFTKLFKHLAQENIEFSVLVFDIIPIEWPELVGEAAHQSFFDWLTTTVNTASLIFVSSALVKDQIQRWAALYGVEVKAEISVISFGLRNIAGALTRAELASDALTSEVNLDLFVLSVGTIDSRKNQMFLCNTWKQLAETIGYAKLPQLVLAGRDDLKITQSADFAELFAAGKILVLEQLPDEHLAGLYKTCLFTAFASLSEGYGLPVAESLQYGKLCLTSNLPVIHEHAGDLVWYFSPHEPTDALDLFIRAIERNEERTAAEERIQKEFCPPKWQDTYENMIFAAQSSLRAPALEVSAGRQLSTYPGAREVVPTRTLAKAARWCTSNPDVSILIINWNAASLTLECVRQIWANTDGYTYEIVIADNGSAPDDVRRLRKLGGGTRLLELGCNRFFGEANNVAAEAARGRYLCLLNNDAFVQEGWLTTLVKGIEENSEVGAAGPMFLFPDGAIQEAGGAVNAGGFPMRFGRGEKEPSPDSLRYKFVDYVSAAALLVRRELFMQAGGFDLAYEPAYYEDVDLCLKIQALGRKVLYCPDAKVIHIEGHSANDNKLAEARRKAMGDINRDKFVSRWGEYLRSRDPGVLTSLRSMLFPLEQLAVPQPPATARHTRARTASIYTPYSLNCGGGESYFLTIAAALADQFSVTVITPRTYSRLRLRNLGAGLNLDLSAIRLATEEDFLAADAPDLLVTVGNHILPSIAGRGKKNVYVCQFPFRMDGESIATQRSVLNDYSAIIVYSEYVRSHVFAALSAHGLPQKTIVVVPPPVQQIGGDAGTKKNIILSVGRFFVGGHSKRHDALIETFKSIASHFPEPVELHLAGSATPEPQHMDYLAKLMSSVQGFPIHFHVNASAEQLHQLYRDAAVYWHGTGIGADLLAAPEKAEHFGISLVEAMSAEVVPFALSSGGPREIIDSGVTGFLYRTPEELGAMTLDLFAASSKERRCDIGRAARHRALEFSREKFSRRITELVNELVHCSDQ